MFWLACLPIFQPDCIFIGNSPFLQLEDARPYLESTPHSIIAVDGGYNYCLDLNLVPEAIVGDFDSINLDWQTSIEEHSIEIEKLPRAKDQTDLEYAIATHHKNCSLVFGGLGGRIDHSFYNLYLLMQYPGQLILESQAETVIALNQHHLFPACPGYKMFLIAAFENPQVKDIDLPAEISLEKPVELFVESGLVLASFVKDTATMESSIVYQLLNTPAAQDAQICILQAGQSKLFETRPGQTISLIPFLGCAIAKTQGLKWELTDGCTHLDHQFMSLSNVALGKSVKVSVAEGRLLCIFTSIVDQEMVSLKTGSTTK